MRAIDVDLDVYRAIWVARQYNEHDENQVLRRVLRLEPHEVLLHGTELTGAATNVPQSAKWTDVLVWSLSELGGQARLHDIYAKSRQARKLLFRPVTRAHDASARECLESHCSDSQKFRGKADLFRMPEGKGSGIWALR